MANFLDATTEIETRLEEYSIRLARIEAHLRRGEKRAAQAQLGGTLEELVEFAEEIKLPLETIVVGAQLGFFSGGELIRGRLPGAMLGAVAGWVYGQQALQRHRLALEVMIERVALLLVMLERESAPSEPDKTKVTEEIDRDGAVVSSTSDRVTLEVDRE